MRIALTGDDTGAGVVARAAVVITADRPVAASAARTRARPAPVEARS